MTPLEFFIIISPLGWYITLVEWGKIVETSYGSIRRVISRVVMLNLPTIIVINDLVRGIL